MTTTSGSDTAEATGEPDRSDNGQPTTGPSYRAGPLLSPLLLGGAMLVVFTSLSPVDPARIGAFGLIEVLPGAYWLGMGMLWVGFAVEVLDARPRQWLLGGYVVGLVMALTAVPALIHEHPRFPTAWMHVGFSDYITRTGEVDTTFDARFSWPGGFVLMAFLTEALGVGSARGLIRWAPTVVNLALIAPLFTTAGAVTTNVRARWLSVWLTVMCLWVGQDYLAPQAYAFVVYLTIVGALLRLGHQPGRGTGWDLLGRLQGWKPALVRSGQLGDIVPAPTVEATPVLSAVVVLLGVSVVVSHQLTPFLLTGATVVLLVTGHRVPAWIAVSLAVLSVGWVVVGASDYLAGHLDELFGEVGRIGQAVGGGVSERFTPHPDRRVVLLTRVAFTAVIGAAGAAGFLTEWVRRRANWALLGLGVFPVGILAFSSYGGEGVLRVALFTTSFLVLLAVVAFTPAVVRRRWLWAAVLAVLGAALVPAYFLARYGNEAFEVTRSEDLALWEATASVAQDGDIVMVPNFAGPWRHTRLTDLEYRVLVDEVGRPADADAAETVLSGREGYLLLGVAGQLYERYANGRPASWAKDVERELLDRPGWEVAFRRSDAVLLHHSAVRAEAERRAMESRASSPPSEATLGPPRARVPLRPSVGTDPGADQGGRGG